MNAVDSHPKVHVALRLTHQPAPAGTVLEGSLDVRTSAQNGLGLAEIKCELVGIEGSSKSCRSVSLPPSASLLSGRPRVTVMGMRRADALDPCLSLDGRPTPPA